MKKLGLLVFFLSVVFYTNAQTSSVALPSATINPKPLAAVENNGVGTGYVSFAESSSADVPAESFPGIPNVTISVNLQYIELTNADTSAITGSLLDYFNVSYDAPSKILTFTQKVLIPGDQFAEVFFPITVTQNSTQAESFNGINANINATSANTNAQGNAGQFTYTLPVVNVLNLVDDSITTDEDTAVVVDVVANDNDVPSTGTLVATNPANGTVSIDDNGTPNDPSDDIVTYTPNADFNGTDTFDYTICDTATPQNCDTATVTVTVNPILDVVDDTPTTDEDTALVVDVVANDNDVPSTGTLVVTNPANGTVTIDDNGTPNDPSDDIVTYTPNADFNGTDTFDYTICDTATPQNCDTATVTVTVNPILDVVDDTPTTDEDTAVVVDVVANDNDVPSTGTLVATNPANGTVTIDDNGTPNDPSDDIVTYTPNTGFNGTDSFDYTICDTATPPNCDTATVTVTVIADAIIVANDDNATGLGGVGVLNVFDNDTSDGTAVNPTDFNLTETVPDPTGALTLNLDGSVDVAQGTPAGTYTLTYQICEVSDPTNCDTAVVTIVVQPGDLVANDEEKTVPDTGGTAVINVLDNETLNGNATNSTEVTVTTTIPDSSGALTLNADGTVDVAAGTPIGVYTIEYQVCEKSNPTNCKTAVVTITVEATDDITNLFPVPEGFTPNGDSSNELFVIPNLAELYPNFSLEIINRYGNKVYSYKHNGNPADEPQWWNGKSDGRWNMSSDVLTNGTYFYAIEFNDSKREPQTGWVYLRR